MAPDSTGYDPRPEYLAELVAATGLTQTQIGKHIGCDARSLRRWITGERTFTYAIQFALECLVSSVRYG